MIFIFCDGNTGFAGKCLALHADSSALVLRDCDDHNSYHKWAWREITPYWAKKQ